MGEDVILKMLEGLLVIRAKKTGDIWRQLFKGQVRQAFIKSPMGRNFHFVSLAVMPEEILGGHVCAAQKDAFSCDQLEPDWAPA